MSDWSWPGSRSSPEAALERREETDALESLGGFLGGIRPSRTPRQ